jgi:cysteine desulfurase / selenocysteine lyase
MHRLPPQAAGPPAGPRATEVDWRAVHAEFPVNQHLVWLNNCGISPPPAAVIAAMEAHLRAYAERGVLGVAGEHAVHESVRRRLAALIQAEPDEIALIHNTAEGLTFISHGLELAPGERILLLENEYPSNVYPWQHWRERGVALDFAPLAATPAAFLAGFRAALTPATRVVSLSAVHWCTGLPLPLAEIGELCAGRGIDLVVDGAQGVGLVPLDVHRLGVAAMAFSAWKWLLGPLGLGALYVRRDRLARLRFPFKGTGSVVDDEVYLPYRDALKPGTDRYVLSTPNFNDWVYFDASLAYLERIGFAAVMARIHALTRHLAEALRRAGFALTADAFPDADTGILAASKPGHEARALVAALGRGGIVAAARLDRVRLAPHVYLLEHQLDAVADRLAALTRA